MHTPARTRPAVLAGVVALVAALPTACNEHAAGGITTPPAPPAPSTPVPTSALPSAAVSTSAAGDSTAEQQRIRAARDAGRPPKDLVWRIPVTRTWTKLPKTENGKQEWHVKPGCRVRLWQLSGASDEPTTTSKDVVDWTAKDNSASFPGKPKPVYRKRGTIMMISYVRGIDDVAKVRMTDAIVDYGPARAEVIGYRSGDLALSYTSYCRTAAAFTKVSASDFNAFRDGLGAEAAY